MTPTAHSSKHTKSTNNGTTNDVDDEEVRPYVIVGDIGKGSFATVYKGYHEASCPCVEPFLSLIDQCK